MRCLKVGASFRDVSKITVVGEHNHGFAARDSAKLRRGGTCMAQDERDLLEILKFELKFLEDGGYGRSPRTPWRPTRTFQDSPTCLNFDDPARLHPCSECLLMRLVPEERKNESVPCWFIPFSARGETVDYYSRCGTQEELEEALADWLRNRIQRIRKRACRKSGAGTQN
jgi:hypothetical protein